MRSKRLGDSESWANYKAFSEYTQTFENRESGFFLMKKPLECLHSACSNSENAIADAGAKS
jgi:hypothetical protein